MKSAYFITLFVFLTALCMVPSTGYAEQSGNTDPATFGEMAEPNPSKGSDSDSTWGPDASGDFQTLDSLFDLYQPYLENISAYEPIYFLVGTDPEETRFQFSFKYRFLNPEMKMARKYLWLRGFHIAYTQTSFWDLATKSQPFKDTSYKPELFFLSPTLIQGDFGVSRLFVQTGYQHESNGRGEELSRSTNFLYIKPIFVFFHENTRLGFLVAPRIWSYVGNDDDTNPDLHQYRGNFDLEIKAGRADGIVLESRIRWADEGTSLRLDLTYPIDELLPTNINVYLQAQYVNMLAESLLNYRERNRAFRLGIAIVR